MVREIQATRDTTQQRSYVDSRLKETLKESVPLGNGLSSWFALTGLVGLATWMASKTDQVEEIEERKGTAQAEDKARDTTSLQDTEAQAKGSSSQEPSVSSQDTTSEESSLSPLGSTSEGSSSLQGKNISISVPSIETSFQRIMEATKSLRREDVRVFTDITSEELASLTSVQPMTAVHSSILPWKLQDVHELAKTYLPGYKKDCPCSYCKAAYEKAVAKLNPPVTKTVDLDDPSVLKLAKNYYSDFIASCSCWDCTDAREKAVASLEAPSPSIISIPEGWHTFSIPVATTGSFTININGKDITLPTEDSHYTQEGIDEFTKVWNEQLLNDTKFTYEINNSNATPIEPYNSDLYRQYIDALGEIGDKLYPVESKKLTSADIYKHQMEKLMRQGKTTLGFTNPCSEIQLTTPEIVALPELGITTTTSLIDWLSDMCKTGIWYEPSNPYRSIMTFEGLVGTYENKYQVTILETEADIAFVTWRAWGTPTKSVEELEQEYNEDTIGLPDSVITTDYANHQYMLGRIRNKLRTWDVFIHTDDEDWRRHISAAKNQFIQEQLELVVTNPDHKTTWSELEKWLDSLSYASTVDNQIQFFKKTEPVKTEYTSKFKQNDLVRFKGNPEVYRVKSLIVNHATGRTTYELASTNSSNTATCYSEFVLEAAAAPKYKFNVGDQAYFAPGFSPHYKCYEPLVITSLEEDYAKRPMYWIKSRDSKDWAGYRIYPHALETFQERLKRFPIKAKYID